MFFQRRYDVENGTVELPPAALATLFPDGILPATVHCEQFSLENEPIADAGKVVRLTHKVIHYAASFISIHSLSTFFCLQ